SEADGSGKAYTGAYPIEPSAPPASSLDADYASPPCTTRLRRRDREPGVRARESRSLRAAAAATHRRCERPPCGGENLDGPLDIERGVERHRRRHGRRCARPRPALNQVLLAASLAPR